MSETESGLETTGDPAAIAEAIQTEVEQVLVGNEGIVEHLTIALFIRGHILLEGVPGVAKTTIANLFAQASGLQYRRIQMTPDILPADITGTNVYRQNIGEFELQRGPVFANLVVADEINRATPKTQSALLEAMQERRVTIEGDTLALPEPFMVVATQNPIEMEGVFELPEAQRDRFQFKLTVDLPERAEEAELLDRIDTDPNLSPDTVEQVITRESILVAQERIADNYVADQVKSYILDLVAATRTHPDVRHGASPRATITFINGAKARAALRDRSYAIPDDIKALAPAILAHRLVLTTDAELSDVASQNIVADVLADTPIPDIEPNELATASDQ